jgi:hypothetical protein
VRTEKGAVAVPADFIEVSQFPETRSGKYMRRMVRALVVGEDVGDVTTLRNPEALDELGTVIADWQRKQRMSDEQALFDRHRYFLVQYNSVVPGKQVATVTVTNHSKGCKTENTAAFYHLGHAIDRDHFFTQSVFRPFSLTLHFSLNFSHLYFRSA